jgi:spore coat polysaccharide biosynthesis predicted glycosyltransferase SpsG
MKTRPQTRTVLFAAAAGPRRGFGHLVRCGVLADSLDVRRLAVLRGATPATLRAAERLGWAIVAGPDAILRLRPDLLIVDDPVPAHRARWVRRARRSQVPAVVLADGGSPTPGADLVIDGSVTSRHVARDGRLAGAAFAILSPAVAAGHERRLPARRRARVIISLGGGNHVRRLGSAIGAAIVRQAPRTDVCLVPGFVRAGALPVLPDGCRWVDAPRGLAALLATASAAVVAGGLTLYEACALGTPVVAVPVVAAQWQAIRALSAAGAAIAVPDSIPGLVLPPKGQCETRERAGVGDAVAAAVCALLADSARAHELGRRARLLIDGRGTERVVARLRRLLHQPITGSASHAA